MAQVTACRRHCTHRGDEDPAIDRNCHDPLFAAAPDPVRARLLAIRDTVEDWVPGAVRCVGYNMPAFRLDRVFFYFGAFRRHVGIYPPVTDDAALVAELAAWRGPKGNLAFPHARDLPLGLIGRVAVALADQYGRRGRADRLPAHHAPPPEHDR